MPVLAVYIGAHDVSGLLYKSSDDYSFWIFPYVYSSELYSCFVTESDFYKSLLEQICKDNGIKLSECDVIVTGFLQPPRLDLNLKMYVSLTDVFSRIHEFYPVLINNYAIVTKDAVYSKKTLVNKDYATLSIEEESFYSNLIIYPQVVASDLVSRIEMDTMLLENLIGEDFKLPVEKPLVFMGFRFNSIHGIDDVNAMLILDLIKTPGVYEIYVDHESILILDNLVRSYLGKATGIKVLPKKLGTIVSTQSPIECMVTSQMGTSQIVELEKDKIFSLPVSIDERVKMSLKTPGKASVEGVVTGGDIGLVFDSREKKGDFGTDYKRFAQILRDMKGGMNG